MLAKYTFLLIDLTPELLQILNRNNIYTEFYFEMQSAILPMSTGHESIRSICRKEFNLAPCKFRDGFRRTKSN